MSNFRYPVREDSKESLDDFINREVRPINPGLADRLISNLNTLQDIYDSYVQWDQEALAALPPDAAKDSPEYMMWRRTAATNAEGKESCMKEAERIQDVCEKAIERYKEANRGENEMPAPEVDTEIEEAKNDIDRQTLIERIRAYASPEMGKLAENKRFNEKALIHIAEQYPESEELMKSFRTLEAASRGLDVSEADMAEAHNALSKTLNSGVYEKAFKDLKKDRDIEKALDTLRLDIAQKALADGFVSGNAQAVNAAFSNVEENKRSNVIESQNPGHFLKEAFKNLGNAFKEVGNAFYKAGCQTVQNAKDSISHVHEVIKDKAQDIRDFGVNIMKNVAGFATLTINKLRNGIETCKNKINEIHEKAKAAVHNKGIDIKQSFLKAANDVHMMNQQYPEAIRDLSSKLATRHHKAYNFCMETANRIEGITKVCALARQEWRKPNLIDAARAMKGYTGEKELSDEEAKVFSAQINNGVKTPTGIPIIGKALSAPFKGVAALHEKLMNIYDRDAKAMDDKYNEFQDKIDKNEEKIDDLEDERV